MCAALLDLETKMNKLAQFTIAGSGQVVASVVQQSTVGDQPVEGCIANAVRGWAFPKPVGGGIVIVSYPFVLKSEPRTQR